MPAPTIKNPSQRGLHPFQKREKSTVDQLPYQML
jgi:hypothetical protein